NLPAALRGLGAADTDLAGRGRLLLDRAGDRALIVVDLNDDLADLRDRFDGSLGDMADRIDLLADILGGPGGFLGKFLDLVGDDGESLARFAGTCRFNRGVQGEQIRLLGDRGDDLKHLADLGAALAQFGHGGRGRIRHFDPRGGNLGRLVGTLGDLANAGPQVFHVFGNG